MSGKDVIYRVTFEQWRNLSLDTNHLLEVWARNDPAQFLRKLCLRCQLEQHSDIPLAVAAAVAQAGIDFIFTLCHAASANARRLARQCEKAALTLKDSCRTRNAVISTRQNCAPRERA